MSAEGEGGAESGLEWLGRFAARAGARAPDEDQVGAILKLASVAAHSSERLAAPLACWVAGSSGLDLEEAIAIAEGLGESD
jgi:hypothetical protein